jgi:hypothetical protein
MPKLGIFYFLFFAGNKCTENEHRERLDLLCQTGKIANLPIPYDERETVSCVSRGSSTAFLLTINAFSRARRSLFLSFILLAGAPE